MEISPWGFPPVPTPLKFLEHRAKNVHKRTKPANDCELVPVNHIKAKIFSVFEIFFPFISARPEKLSDFKAASFFPEWPPIVWTHFFDSKVKIQIYRFWGIIFCLKTPALCLFSKGHFVALKGNLRKKYQTCVKYYRVRSC